MRSATLAVTAAREAGEAAADITRAASAALLATRLATAALCVAPPLAAFAMAYPLAVRVRALDPARAAAAAGSTYAWNTAGNVLGSLLAGFVLLPAIGGPRTLAVFGGLSLATAVAIRLLASRPRRLAPAWVPLAGILLLAIPGAGPRLDVAGPSLPEAVALDRWSESFEIRTPADAAAFAEMLGGTYPRPAGRPDLDADPPARGHRSAASACCSREAVVRLRQGALSESKILPNEPDTGSETEVALAAIPFLAHPDPKRGARASATARAGPPRR